MRAVFIHMNDWVGMAYRVQVMEPPLSSALLFSYLSSRLELRNSTSFHPIETMPFTVWLAASNS